MTSSSAATQREATAQSYVDEYEFPALSEEGGSWVGGGGSFGGEEKDKCSLLNREARHGRIKL